MSRNKILYIRYPKHTAPPKPPKTNNLATNMETYQIKPRTCKMCTLCNKRSPYPNNYTSQERITDESNTVPDPYDTSPQNWVTVHFSRWDSALPQAALLARIAEYIRAGRGSISSYPKSSYLSWCYSVPVDRSPGFTDQEVFDRAVGMVEGYVCAFRGGLEVIDVQGSFVDGVGEYIFV